MNFYLLASLVFVKSGQHSTSLLSGRGQNGTNDSIFQSRDSLPVVYGGFVRQLVVSGRSLNELAFVI